MRCPPGRFRLDSSIVLYREMASATSCSARSIPHTYCTPTSHHFFRSPPRPQHRSSSEAVPAANRRSRARFTPLWKFFSGYARPRCRLAFASRLSRPTTACWL